MANSYFQFKQFIIHQDRCAMKVTTDGCLFGAWVANEVRRRKSDARKVLDIGSGTGLLSLMLAQKNPDVRIDAIEIDKDAAGQAKENIAASQWKDRIDIFNADVSTFSFHHRYDVIVSNPPFYENELKSPDEKKNMAHHEGLSLDNLIRVISGHLNGDGGFYLLLPYKRTIEASHLISKYELEITESVMVKQSTQHDYFRMFVKGKRLENKQSGYTKTELAIRDDKQEYTSDFVELLKDYYLHL